MSRHPIARRLTEQNIEKIKEMTIAGSHPREIVSILRQNDKSILITTGCTPIQALINDLKEGDFVYKYKYDNN
ncbi:21754_t:CDS:2, partial [Racocetra persica]